MKEYFSEKNGFDIHKPLAIKLLKQTIDILNEFRINHFLISGTLLGYIRHNDFIPWDDDIDLLVDNSILNKLEHIVNKYPNINLFFKEKYDSVKICFTDGIQVSDKSNWNNKAVNDPNGQKKYTWPFIDLFTYEKGPGLHACGKWEDININGLKQRIFLPFSGPCDSCFRFIKEDDIVFFHNNWSKNNFFPLQEVNFLGIKCNIPNNPHHFLSKNYGTDYMTIVESSSRIHKTDNEIKNIIKTRYDNIRR
jgi:phosphorylcholine metabolism protein LicD